VQLFKPALSSKTFPATDIPMDPDILVSFNSEPEIKAFDESVDSGECIFTDL